MNTLQEILNMEIWNQVFWSNTLGDYAVALLVFLGIFSVIKILEIFVIARMRKVAKRTVTDWDDLIIRVVKTVDHPFHLFIAFYISIRSLNIHNTFQVTLNVVLTGWLVYQAMQAMEEIIDYYLERVSSEKGQRRGARTSIRLVRILAKSALWVLGVILILSNLGINVSSLIAGLGIGGVAIALAVREILSDLFSSFAISLDKPFVIGDLIVVDDVTGRVEKIGIKTTRVRSLEGEEVVFSNQQLTSKKIKNYKKMDKRRVLFTIGVAYETPNNLLDEIPTIIEDVINSIEDIEFGRSNLSKLGDSALEYENVYYVPNPDFDIYRDIHEKVLKKIKKRFDEEDISMPYPTRSVYLNKVD